MYAMDNTYSFNPRALYIVCTVHTQFKVMRNAVQYNMLLLMVGELMQTICTTTTPNHDIIRRWRSFFRGTLQQEWLCIFLHVPQQWEILLDSCCLSFFSDSLSTTNVAKCDTD